MQTLEKRLVVGFRRQDDWASALVRAFQSFVALLDLATDDTEEARSSIESMVDDLAPLIYAQIVRALEVEFAACVCRIVIGYEPFGNDQDDLDFSILRMVEIKTESLSLRIIVTDAEYAQYLGAGRLETTRWTRLHVSVCGLRPLEEEALAQGQFSNANSASDSDTPDKTSSERRQSRPNSETGQPPADRNAKEDPMGPVDPVDPAAHRSDDRDKSSAFREAQGRDSHWAGSHQIDVACDADGPWEKRNGNTGFSKG